MQCPKCSRELFEVEQSRVSLDCCPGCHGLWFDRGELEKISGVPDALARLGTGVPTELACPRCTEVLHEHSTDAAIGVAVDRCGGCFGIWLDRGELDAFRKRERPNPRGRSRPPERRDPPGEKLTLKELLLRFVDSSIDRLREP